AIHPEANKNLFFTQKDKDLYVICTNWPKGNIALKGLKTTGAPKVELLGSDRPVSARVSGGNLVITPPALGPDDYQHAYVFKITSLK
ncbi:MAG: alpha-L-fucosidase, partial [Bacteroidales bacterium]|nr:alpha-L-fucosidase [Bacteroidales bacterium]